VEASISCNKILYLILDECWSHLTAEVRKAFADCNTEVDLIPGDYTSRLQPMDVGLNKPFKGYVCDNYTDWLNKNRNRKPTRQDVLKWIMNGWSRVSEGPKMGQHIFGSCSVRGICFSLLVLTKS
jgi:DDE superfamily endonuclease